MIIDGMKTVGLKGKSVKNILECGILGERFHITYLHVIALRAKMYSEGVVY